MKNKIKFVKAREILDSRANPTVEAKIILESGAVGIASVPSGASTGIHEAHELRDNDKSRFNGRGVLLAVENVEKIIAPAIIGKECDYKEIDKIMKELDGSDNKSNLGANAILAVSIASARAAANHEKSELYEYLGGYNHQGFPIPMFNVLNGGAHASNNIDIQEFMIVPYGLSYGEALRAGSEIYHTLGLLLKAKGLSTGVGDEGGYAPNLSSDEEAMDLLCLAIKKSGYDFNKVGIALDVASSEWYENGSYHLPKRDRIMSADELIEYYQRLIKTLPIISIEDGLAEDDFDGWQRLTSALKSKVMLVGDDLFVTNEKRLKEGISLGIGNSILIKPNQIGTLSETLSVISLAKEAGYKVIISHRSGETSDSAIADIGIAAKADFIKAGAPCRGERVAKYNRLSEIINKF